MATQSAATVPPQTLAADTVQPTSENQQDAKAEATKQNSTTSVFVNSEPIREDQVENAVKFLSHPKVRGSPVIYRRSFLEKKGLTKEEIDEAFRRVPDPSPSAQTTSINQDGQVKSSPNVQPQLSVQTLQPTAVAPTGVISSVGTLSRYQFHWSHAFLAVGLLAVSGAGTAVLVKKTIVPRLKSWVRKVVSEDEDDPTKQTTSKPSLAEEAAAATIAAASAAADVAKACQEMLNSKSEEKKYFEAFANLLDVQVKEMKSMSDSIRKLEGSNLFSDQGQTNTSGRLPLINQEDYRVSAMSSKRQNGNDRAGYDSRSVRSTSPPRPAEPSLAPHPKSYMEIMEMIQRGERPPNIREINDLPPNPNQQPSIPRLAPRTKPWDVSTAQNVLHSQGSGEGLNTKVQENGSYQSYVDTPVPWRQQRNGVAELGTEDEVRSGPSGAPNPSQHLQRTWVPPLPPPVAMPEAAEAIRRPKPLVQKEQLADKPGAHHSDVTDELQRVTKISESGGEVKSNVGSSGFHSTEIQVQEHMSGPSDAPNPAQPLQRTWVPPLPPPVAMPEAAEAIRRPKPLVQKEQLADQPVAHHSDVTDELQRVTKISESGGEVKSDGGSSGLHSSEIQVEEHKSGSFGTPNPEQPAQHTWVPPVPHPVSMPEAARAIQQPKPLVEKEQLVDEGVGHHSDVTEESQRVVAQISESGGEVKTDSGSSGLQSSEIQEEEYGYEV